MAGVVSSLVVSRSIWQDQHVLAKIFSHRQVRSVRGLSRCAALSGHAGSVSTGAVCAAFLVGGRRISTKLRSSQRASAVTEGATVEVDAYLKAKVEEMIALQPVMIFSKSWCPFCAKAKDALKQRGIPAAVCELDTLGPEMEEKVQDVLQTLTSARTVPRVFIGGKCIGGGTDTERLAEEGALEGLAGKAMEVHKDNLAGGGSFQIKMTTEEWQSALTPQQFKILRQRGTEPPGSHQFDQFLPEVGYFSCAGCGLPLYSAESKYASNCGWPVFDKCYASSDIGQHVSGRPDGTGSLEIICTRCGSHLGHVFYDAISEANPNGERH
eukprot:CAMPEP_0197704250 /NCGR_PEP_ID=MMETSP1338-20131121/125845_1 /TAXON_ID=43686 ORGANISM="Pelagodinium beii, Strain RCC1491" /NCGR_SAMPLE_ID=MMETSP1338 /ASSEMBLY_ACC=CAM_ASM_000754 /LENGTH=324 /DNA_ID=CAMNT_0043288149 /DNA_START=84 /DNA_END=1058 /DNA_ORIENTATION=+